MPFFRVVMIVESKIDNEDDLLEDLVDKNIGKHRITDVEEVELADDFDRGEDDDDEDESPKEPND